MKLDCQSMDERIVDYVYDELEDEELASVKAHLEDCPECREQVGALMGTRTVMSEIEVASPMRDDTYVLQVAGRQAKCRGISEERLGLLERLGRWFSHRPGLVAVPAAGLMLVAIVSVTLGDEIRAFFGASADALAGDIFEPRALLHHDEAVRKLDADREARLLLDSVDTKRRLEEDTHLVERDLAAPKYEHEPRTPMETAPAGQVASPPPRLKAAPTRERSAERRLSQAPAEHAQARRAAPRSSLPPPSSHSAEDSSAGSLPRLEAAPAEEASGFTPDVGDRVEALSRSRRPAAAQARRAAPSPGPLVEYRAEADMHEATGEESRSFEMEEDSSRQERSELHPTLQRAAHLFNRGEYEKVLALLSGFSSSTAEILARAHVLRAQSLERLGRQSEARLEWQGALEADPDGSWGETARGALESY